MKLSHQTAPPLGFSSFLPLFFLVLLGGTASTGPHSVSAEDFRFSADTLSSQFSEGEKKTILSGSARIISGPTSISAPRIALSGSDYRYAEAKGGVSIQDSEQGFTATASSLYFDRVKKSSRIRGNAVLEDMENGVIVKGEYLENQQENQLTTVQINVRIFKDDIVARCGFARYLREDEILELTGRPEVYKGDNEYRADRIIIDLDTDEISLRGAVQGEMISSKSDKEEEDESEEDESEEGKEQ